METFKKHYFFPIFLLTLARSIIFSSTLVESACNAIDKEALLQFKRGIEYDSSGNLQTWDPKTDCCASWNKVICNNKTGRVVEISPFRPVNPMDLDISIFVNGTLSAYLGNLTSLQHLDLNHFQQYYLDSPAGISGAIPPQLGQLSQLNFLSMGQNIHTGSIPTSFANLHRLKYLDLGFNHLSGSIPSSLFQSMKSLERLFLDHNKLSGSIPFSIVNLISLNYLQMNNNSLSGEIPSVIGSLKKLTSIDLSLNKLTKKIPDSLGQLPQLFSLKLDHNKLNGNIPANVLNLKNLEWYAFDVSINKLTGKIPPHKTNFSASAFRGNPGLCDAPLPPCKRL